MLQETYIEQLVDFVVADIKLFKLLKSHNTLDFFYFTSCNIQYSYILKRSSNVSETSDYRINQLQEFKTG